MLFYACGTYEHLYLRLVFIETYDMSYSGHIVYKSNRKTVKHKYRRNKNGKPTKRGPSQINERPPRPDYSSVSKLPAHARLPSHNQNTQNLRRLLRTKHHLPTTRHPRKERLRQQPMEHEQPTPQKSLPTHKRRTKHAKLHRKLTKPDLPENWGKRHT
jgi:hypothetical protein